MHCGVQFPFDIPRKASESLVKKDFMTPWRNIAIRARNLLSVKAHQRCNVYGRIKPESKVLVWCKRVLKGAHKYGTLEDGKLVLLAAKVVK